MKPEEYIEDKQPTRKPVFTTQGKTGAHVFYPLPTTGRVSKPYIKMDGHLGAVED